jgi:hypothetical protein
LFFPKLSKEDEQELDSLFLNAFSSINHICHQCLLFFILRFFFFLFIHFNLEWTLIYVVFYSILNYAKQYLLICFPICNQTFSIVLKIVLCLNTQLFLCSLLIKRIQYLVDIYTKIFLCLLKIDFILSILQFLQFNDAFIIHVK